MGLNEGPNRKEVRDAIEVAMKKSKSKGMRLTSFAITPEQAVEAMRLGVDELFLGFDPMYVQASWRTSPDCVAVKMQKALTAPAIILAIALVANHLAYPVE